MSDVSEAVSPKSYSLDDDDRLVSEGATTDGQGWPTIAEALEHGRVLSIWAESDLFVLQENCDQWFRVRLTRDQFGAWVDELRGMLETATEGMP